MLRLVSVGSFRRGVGKSIISANLAMQAAEMGWRVGVVDLDYVYPNAQNHLFSLPDTTRTLTDYLSGAAEIDAIGARPYPGRMDDLWVFPWGSSPMPHGVDMSELNRGLFALSSHHNLDFVILDLTSGFGDFNVLMEAISDCAVLVMRPDQMDYPGTASMVSTARALDVQHIHLIVNQVSSHFDRAQVQSQIGTAYRVPASTLPFVEDMIAYGTNNPYHEVGPWYDALRSMAGTVFPALMDQAPWPLPGDLSPVIAHGAGGLVTGLEPCLSQGQVRHASV